MIHKLADLFYKLASEKLPENSKDLSVILKNLDNLETYQARKKYAERNLKHLSSGSSRVVYITKNNTILKLAKNDKGIDQNKTECNPKMKSKFKNKILKHSKKFIWMEVPYLKKITTVKFKKMTGIDFSDFCDTIKYALKDISSSKKAKPKCFDEVSKTEIFKEVKALGEKFKLMPGDLGKISSWGENEKNPVLIDTGLSKEVFEKHYE